MAKLRLSRLFALPLLFVAVSASAGEMDVRQTILSQVHSLVQQGDFDGLNAMEREYRTTRARTPNGTWKLQEFYLGLNDALPRPDERNQDDCIFHAREFVDSWSKATPQSPAPHIVEAQMLVQQAWCFRGDGYASDVTDAGWAAFHKSIAAADALLSEHRVEASVDPEYYVTMENIYRSEGRERGDFRKLLDEATSKEPNYYGIYWAAYPYYEPQWFGSPADIDAMARYAIERTRSKDGLGAYARLFMSEMSDDCTCWRDAIDWQTMKQAMHDVATRYPEPWNFANFAKLSCVMEDKDTAREYFAALKEDDGSAAWPADKEGWKTCRTLAGFKSE